MQQELRGSFNNAVNYVFFFTNENMTSVLNNSSPTKSSFPYAIKLKKKTWNITQETAYLQHHLSIYFKCLMFNDE